MDEEVYALELKRDRYGVNLAYKVISDALNNW